MSPRGPRFEWDEANIAHIARHEVAPEEVEEAFIDDRAIFKDFDERNGERRYSMIGCTAEDRFLSVAYIIRTGKIRAVTAHTANRKDRRLYLDKRRINGVTTS